MGITTALAIGAVATGASIKKGKDAAKHSNKANRAQEAINRLQNAQNRRAFLRQFRQAQAAAIAGGVARGTGDSSLALGTMESERSQRSVALQEFQRMEQLGGVVAKQSRKAANDQFRAGVLGQIGSFATSAGGQDLIDAGVDKIKGIFS